MKHNQLILSRVLDTLFFFAVIAVAFSIATIALTHKVNQELQWYNNGLFGTVAKQDVDVLAFTRGVVTDLHIRTGTKVKKNDLLVELDNPLLKNKVETLSNQKDNLSAKTEAEVAKQDLNNLSVYSHVDGTVENVFIAKGSSINELEKLATISSNEDVRLLINMTIEQYQTIKRQSEIIAYSPRLDSQFKITFLSIVPNDQKDTSMDTNTIGVYFTFENQQEAGDLLNNENLRIILNKPKEKMNKPIDVFINFWNGLISANTLNE